ncbi:MAG: winged helix-turn-helix transcriptional regulator [Nitrospina sp.]|jgi:DNA-binding transcriptional ArsR family regulator|nr:winged helix-turn-helix transcriptional regulator [Nitrospina sp.]MBT5632402.1 winged helix-turn-helix transcriptional regulator [Nitrospina sp.]
MANQINSQLDNVFFALSHPTRRQMLDRLIDSDLSVTDISRGYNNAGPTISKHLRVMESAGLIQRTKRGRVHWVKLNPKPLKGVGDWMGQYKKFWDISLSSLDTYLKKISTKKRK